MPARRARASSTRWRPADGAYSSCCGLIAVCLLFAFPVFWLVLTSLRPGLGVYYVHRGTEFTLDNFHEVLSQEIVLKAICSTAS